MKIYNADCLAILPTLEDKSVDLIIADLPYGEIQCEWDNQIDLQKLWSQFVRVLKTDKSPVLFFGSLKFGMLLINSKPKWFRYELIWDKVITGSFMNVNRMPCRSHEYVFVFSKKGTVYNRIDAFVEGAKAFEYIYTDDKMYNNQCFGKVNKPKHNSIQQANHRAVPSIISVKKLRGHNGSTHPTEKPIELYKWLIERYSNERDLVLDPTCGSFNSGVTSLQLNRDYIGIEMNKEYFNKYSTKLYDASSNEIGTTS